MVLEPADSTSFCICVSTWDVSWGWFLSIMLGPWCTGSVWKLSGFYRDGRGREVWLPLCVLISGVIWKCSEPVAVLHTFPCRCFLILAPKTCLVSRSHAGAWCKVGFFTAEVELSPGQNLHWEKVGDLFRACCVVAYPSAKHTEVPT